MRLNSLNTCLALLEETPRNFGVQPGQCLLERLEMVDVPSTGPVLMIGVLEHGLNVDQSKIRNEAHDMLRSVPALLKVFAVGQAGDKLDGTLNGRSADIL